MQTAREDDERERKGEETERARQRESKMATHYPVISKIFTLNSVEHHHDETSSEEIKFSFTMET